MRHPSEIQLIELASRRLSAAEAAVLMDHVSGCANCAKMLRELEQVHAALGNWGEITHEIELVDTIQRRLDAGSKSSVSLFPRWLRSSAVAAAVVISIASGHLLARKLTASRQQQMVPQPAIEDQLQIAVLAEPGRTGLAELLNTETDFDGVIP